MEGFQFLSQLESIIDDRLASPSTDSYTARLAGQGIKRVAQKLGEEGVEVALAALDDSPTALNEEAADLLFHLLVLLRLRDLSLADVVQTLEQRHQGD